MSLQRRYITVDEELGKKDDDHREGRRSAMSSPTTTNFTWRGPRRKRILLAIAVFSILYIFFKNLPKDAALATRRQGLKSPAVGSSRQAPSAPKGPPPRSDSSVDERRYFEGPIKYYRLGASFAAGLGPVHDNRNVLFVVSNLKSASRILPLACDMSKQNKNRIHLMLTGRDEIAIEDIQKINGVTEADCSIRWHDGRPDFSVYSTDYRMEVSVRASLGHITSVLKPRVVLVDSPEREDIFFTTGIKDKTRDLGLPLIELPVNAAEQLQWISKLDGSSLKAWNEINIEILIHSPPESSGSLIRLLRSLERADYFGFPHPRLTIELPNNMDPPTAQFLSSFRWPPWSHTGNSKLTLRHRLLSNHLDATQASIRQLESFYPSNVPQSNVLVLSPQVELSPLYFHYLVYTLLDYKHSNTALHTSEGIMGISLERPFTTLNGKDSLSIPEEASTKPLFRYQAPNSNAALYFGDKWVELHSFLSNRLAADKDVHKDGDAAYSISQAYPSWLNHVLELARARGYTMLYPSLSSSEAALATIHTELYHPPEEYLDPTPIMAENPPPSKETPLTASSEPIEITHGPKFEPPVASGSLLHLLNPKLSSSDSGGPLPGLSDLPILSYTGEYLPQGQVSLNQAALSYADDFSRHLGGCNNAGSGGGEKESKKNKKKKKKQTRPTRKPWSADDLFCLEEGETEESLGVGRMPPSTQQTEGAAQKEDVGEEHAGRPVDVDKDG